MNNKGELFLTLTFLFIKIMNIKSLLITKADLESVYNKNKNNVICTQPNVVDFFKETMGFALSFVSMICEELSQFQIINQTSDSGTRTIHVALKIDNLIIYLMYFDYYTCEVTNYQDEHLYYHDEFKDINKFINYINMNIELVLNEFEKIKIKQKY